MDKNYLMELSNDSNLSIRIPKELRDVFNEFCKKNLLNPSAVVRSLIIDFMIDYDKDKK